MIKKNYIPTINISSLLEKNFNTKPTLKIVKEIEKACLDVGFFQITGHGIKLKNINKICKVGENFFKLNIKNKLKLAPKKWNKKNKNVYRGYFPNDVNGKEGLDLGDLKVTKKYSKRVKNQYIEYLNIKQSFTTNNISKLSDYYDDIFNLSEILFKSIIKIYNKDTDISKRAFSRLQNILQLSRNF